MSAKGPAPSEQAGGAPLEELYERARALEPEARAAFLAEACRGDPGLQAELRSLLAEADPAEAFFAGLARATGPTVGHYRLLGPLGSGGMGTVYRAHDLRLNRQVALKFLPPHLASQPEARERLLVEARAAAALEHPNVCSVHEIGETADGRPFITMACYEGETLKERLRRGPLPPAEAAAIAVQIARGLGAAHARGIVHRDIKPGNIMLLTDGTVRLLDFGLAKLADVTLTGPGVTPGTIAYMSPEQSRGDPVDRRSDLWSFGVVLYEMLTGRRPFRGETDRVVLQAILHDEPEPLTASASVIPRTMARVVERLLRKDPRDRYQSIEEVAVDLGRSSAGAIRSRSRWGGPALLVTGLAALAVAARLLAGPEGARQEIGRLAVLPLANLTGERDREYFVDGVHDALVSELSQIPELVVISRQSTNRYRGSTQSAPAIARELGVDALLEGSVFLEGDSVHITVQLVRAHPEQQLWAASYRRDLQSALALQEEVARAVAGAIHVRAVPRIGARTTAEQVSPEAQDAYLKGLYYQERVIQAVALDTDALLTIRTAIGWLEQAVALAPQWAAAHAKLARAYHWLASSHPVMAAEYYPKSKSAALRALELDERQAQAHASLGFVLFQYESDWAGAERAIRRAVELDANSHQWIYAMYLVAAGRTEEAVARFRLAQERNPLSTIVTQQLASAYACQGRFDAAIAELRALADRLNDSPGWLRSTLAGFYLEAARYPEALSELEALAVVADSDAQALAELANGYASAGRLPDARRLLARVEGGSGEWYLPELYLALGDTNRALQMVEDAFDATPTAFVYFRCSPIYRRLGSEPRIQRIVGRLRFPE